MQEPPDSFPIRGLCYEEKRKEKKNGNSAVSNVALYMPCWGNQVGGALESGCTWGCGATATASALPQPNIMPPPTSICFFPERGRGTPVGRGTLMGRIMKLAEEHDVLPTEMTLLPQRERQD